MVLTHLCPTSIIAGDESPYMVCITAMTSLVRVCSGKQKHFQRLTCGQQKANKSRSSFGHGTITINRLSSMNCNYKL